MKKARRFSTARRRLRVPMGLLIGGLLHAHPAAPLTALAQPIADLGVTYIQRLPRDTCHYEVEYVNGVPFLRPGTESAKRWPQLGEPVSFVAHVLNRGPGTVGAINYRWRTNGVVAATGSLGGLTVGQEGMATLSWTWNIAGSDQDHADQTVTFELDYDRQISDPYRQNNTLTDFLEGLALEIFVEPALYDAMRTRTNLVGTYNFDDWMQEHIRELNNAFARSTYPTAPNGALERVRMDTLTVGSPGASTSPSADGRWHLTGGESYASRYAGRIDGGLIHELMHQLGVIDLYQLNVEADRNEVVTPDGLSQGSTFNFARSGLMGGGDIAPHDQEPGSAIYLSEHTVAGLNRNVGFRRGYYGEYLYDIPLVTDLVVLDSQGNPAPNVSIRIFQRQSGPIPNTPVITGTTDGTGRMRLPNRAPAHTVTTDTGHTLRANPFGTVNVVGENANLLVEMSRPGGDFDYAWMDITQFNLAHYGGQIASWTHTIQSRLAAVSWPRITDVHGVVSASQVLLQWTAVPGASAYRVYRASSFRNRPEDPLHQYENWVYRPIAEVPTPSFTDSTLFESSRYAVTAVAADGREGPLSTRFFAPWLRNPWAVGVLQDNRRVILDPQNGYALLRQLPNGSFLGTFGSVHYHLEYSRFMAIDEAAGCLIFAHPGDYYTDRHSVRVSDLDGNALLEFGDTGSAPGQFQGPTGVAIDPEHRIYAMDSGNNRIQVFTPAGTRITTFGSGGSGPGQFDNAHGIAVDPWHRIYVCDRGNARVQVLQFDGGTIAYRQTFPHVFGAPVGIALARNGCVYVSDYQRNSVELFDSNGAWLNQFTQPTDGAPGSFRNPTGLAVGRKGELVVCDTGNKRIVTVGGSTTNGPPVVSLISPATNTVLTGDSISLTAEASDIDGLVALVEFFANGIKLGEDTTAPFSVVWSNPAPGCHALVARATDDQALSTQSDLVIVKVLSSASTLLPAGSAWRYWDSSVFPGSSWPFRGYNDGAWPLGPAQLGFGDSDEATLINNDSTRITTYFRQTFDVLDPTSIGSLTARLLRDDGAVVYLNGVEVWRSNMPATGAITPSLWASSGVTGEEENTWHSTSLNPERLVSGLNVVAVEVHQNTTTSSDLSFDFELRAEPPGGMAPLVPAGSVWRFSDTGQDLGEVWHGPGYNDNSWASGPAQLGYGDGDEATVVSYGPEANNKHITTYFRHAFEVTNKNLYVFLILRLLRDDGAVVYLNGTEIRRDNLPAFGPIASSTLALSAVSEADESTFFESSVSPDLLVEGTNFLAVETHQSDPGSSDVSFDLELIAHGSVTAPCLTAGCLGDQIEVTWPAWAVGTMLWSTTNLAPNCPWLPLAEEAIPHNGLLRLCLPITDRQRFFRLDAPRRGVSVLNCSVLELKKLNNLTH